MEWISVKDKLPMKGVDVLVTNNIHVWTAYYNGEGAIKWDTYVDYCINYESESIPDKEYLYWMPMIDLPVARKENQWNGYL